MWTVPENVEISVTMFRVSSSPMGMVLWHTFWMHSMIFYALFLNKINQNYTQVLVVSVILHGVCTCPLKKGEKIKEIVKDKLFSWLNIFFIAPSIKRYLAWEFLEKNWIKFVHFPFLLRMFHDFLTRFPSFLLCLWHIWYDLGKTCWISKNVKSGLWSHFKA